MSHGGYFLHIEGISVLPASEAYTMTGTHNPASGTTLGTLSQYEAIPVLASGGALGSVNYAVDPVARTADVGVLNVSLVDNVTTTITTGTLTDLFAINKQDTEYFLDTTVYQDSSATTLSANETLDSLTFPLDFYIERETFRATGNTGAMFTGVSRGKYKSIARTHNGYTVDDYRPRIRTNPPYWAGRQATLFRVIDDAVTTAQQVWSGPLLDLTPTGVNTWVMRIGNVIRLLQGEVFSDSTRQTARGTLHALPDNVNVDYVPAEPGENGNPTAWHYLACRPIIQVLREGLSVTKTPTTASSIVTSDLGDPDDHWNSQHAIVWDSGTTNEGYACIVKDWDQSSNTMDIQTLPAAAASGETFKLVQWNDFPPTQKQYGFTATLDEEAVGVRLANLDLNATTDPGSMDGLTTWAVVRGIEGSDLAQHSFGSELREVFTNYRMNSDSVAGVNEFAKEVRGLGTATVKQNPLLWFLELATSTGDGWNGTYDVLPSHHGMGINAAYFRDLDKKDGDGDGFAEIADLIDPYRIAYTEPVKLWDVLVKDICKPLGLYPAIDSTGRLMVRRIQRHNEVSTPDLTITEADLIGVPRVNQNHVGVIPGIKFKHNWKPWNGEYWAVNEVVDKDSEFYYRDNKADETETHIWTYAPRPWTGSDNQTALQFLLEVLQPSANRVLERAANPSVKVGITIPFERDDGTSLGLSARPGQTVKLTVEQIPLPDNTRSMSGEWFEIQNVTLDFDRSVAMLELLWLGWYGDKYARWSYHGVISDWDAGTKGIKVVNSELPSGADAQTYVSADDVMRIHYNATAWKGGATYGSTAAVTVDSVPSATSIILKTAPAAAPTVGDIIVYGDYADATATQKELAYFADEGDSDIPGDETLNGDDPNVWVG